MILVIGLVHGACIMKVFDDYRQGLGTDDEWRLKVREWAEARLKGQEAGGGDGLDTTRDREECGSCAAEEAGVNGSGTRLIDEHSTQVLLRPGLPRTDSPESVSSLHITSPSVS